MKKVTVREYDYVYNEKYIEDEEVMQMILGMLEKTGGAHPDRVQKMLDVCARIRSNPAWRGGEEFSLPREQRKSWQVQQDQNKSANDAQAS